MKLYIVLALIILLLLIGVWILNLPVFGKHPKKGRQQRLKKLPNYDNGELKNESFTPTKPADVSYWEMIIALIKGNKNGSPKKPLPHLKPDFNRSEQLKITWFGHSSYLIQVDGKNILVDPVFSARTSPFQFLGTKNFLGTDFIEPADFPPLDLILITHDHYDHLDYQSILKLKAQTTHFVATLGVGAHLTHWGIPENQITELAWGETTSSMQGIAFTAAPARHFSGRGFKRNQTLWASYILKTKNNTLYLGGDSGYDKHFKEIGKKYGPFDLAVLECGQYNTMWPFIHQFPEEVVQASIDLKAACFMPVHWGKYKLALHDWDEPIKRVVAESNALGIRIATPMLGESFYLDGPLPSRQWWSGTK
ncbi:MAG: MBL fold metallo-hydrolase [Bacteroidota bacterium]